MNTRVMKFKELRNEEGMLSALVIKAEDIKGLQENLKPNSALSNSNSSTLSYSKIGGMMFYKVEDVERMLEKDLNADFKSIRQ